LDKFLKMIIEEEKLCVPNETTRMTFDDTDAGRNLVQCKDAHDMFDKLDMWRNSRKY